MSSPRANGTSSPSGFPQVNGFAPHANTSSPSADSTFSLVHAPENDGLNGDAPHVNGDIRHMNGHAPHLNRDDDAPHSNGGGAPADSPQLSTPLVVDLRSLASDLIGSLRADYSGITEDERERELSVQFLDFQNRLFALVGFTNADEIPPRVRNQSDLVFDLADSLNNVLEDLIHLDANRAEMMNDICELLEILASSYAANVTNDETDDSEHEPEEVHLHGEPLHMNGRFVRFGRNVSYPNGDSLHSNGGDSHPGSFSGTTNGTDLHSSSLPEDLHRLAREFMNVLNRAHPGPSNEDEGETLLTTQFVTLQTRLRSLVGFQSTDTMPTRLRDQPDSIVELAQHLYNNLGELIHLQGSARLEQIAEFREMMATYRSTSFDNEETNVDSQYEQWTEQISQLGEFAAWLLPQILDQENITEAANPEESENEGLDGSQNPSDQFRSRPAR